MTWFKAAFAVFSVFVFSCIFAIFTGALTIDQAQAHTAKPAKAAHRASLILIDERPYGASAAASPEMSWAACLKAKRNFRTLAGKHAQRYTCLDLETGDLAH